MVLSMERWVGTVAIVTGASAGIGAATAEALVVAGLKVVGLARRKERIEELSKKLSNQKGKLYALKCDLSKEQDILKAYQWIEENVGHPQILINNAGVILKSSITDGDTAGWKKLYDVNVFGLLITSREIIRILKKNNLPGHIVNINSIVGQSLMHFPGLNVYPSSKWAVTSITNYTSKELLSQQINNIKVTSLSPGGVATEIFPAANLEDLPTDVPRLKSEEVADAVVYVLSTAQEVQINELTIQPLFEEY
ncbi:hypothetical protein ABEB36_001600 [Hypothenemus hampei]|uniref:Farnesol dehydrogenase n=1 Tax=Hypothenemus hampei TaxID=57062 RepID=A0ABD1FF33_HYPHA